MAKKNEVVEVIYTERGEDFPAQISPLPLEKGEIVDIDLSTMREVSVLALRAYAGMVQHTVRHAKGLKLPHDLGHGKNDINLIPLIEIRGEYFKAAEIGGKLIAVPDVQVCHTRNARLLTNVRHKEHGAPVGVPYWRFKDEK